WLMNFEEHCEVLLTTDGAERQRDADILGKCLLGARTKGKDMSQFGKVTVDSPIPYLLTDLNSILVNEMGKLDRAGDTLPFQRLKTKLDELRADPRYTFMFSAMLVSDSMGSFVAKLFRLPSHGRPTSPVACCRSAARSSQCASTTSATRLACVPPCPKVRAAFSTQFRHFVTASASSAARASRSRSASVSTTSSPRSAPPPPTRALLGCGARPATKKASSSEQSSAG